jgi:hypothetical protein
MKQPEHLSSILDGMFDGDGNDGGIKPPTTAPDTIATSNHAALQRVLRTYVDASPLPNPADLGPELRRLSGAPTPAPFTLWDRHPTAHQPAVQQQHPSGIAGDLSAAFVGSFLSEADPNQQPRIITAEQLHAELLCRDAERQRVAQLEQQYAEKVAQLESKLLTAKQQQMLKVLEESRVSLSWLHHLRANNFYRGGSNVDQQVSQAEEAARSKGFRSSMQSDGGTFSAAHLHSGSAEVVGGLSTKPHKFQRRAMDSTIANGMLCEQDAAAAKLNGTCKRK